MKHYEMKGNGSATQAMKCSKASWRPLARYALVTGLILVGIALQTTKSVASGTGYAISLTPHIDPVTGNFKVSINGYRGLNAHVINTPTNTPAAGVAVTFYTTRGTLSTTYGTTSSNGDIGTTLWGGWEPGSANIRAIVTKNGTDYSDIVIIPVVAPNGEDTRIGGHFGPMTAFSQNLTPSDVNFQGLSVVESGNGGTDNCYWSGSQMAPFTGVTGGTWPVYTNNSWGDDYLTWTTDAILYYRSAGRAPCGTTIPQSMYVVRPGYVNGNLFYTKNSGPLILSIQSSTVKNTRDAVTDTITY